MLFVGRCCWRLFGRRTVSTLTSIVFSNRSYSINNYFYKKNYVDQVRFFVTNTNTTTPKISVGESDLDDNDNDDDNDIEYTVEKGTMDEKFINYEATKLSLRPAQLKSSFELFSSGCTVPFVVRYRKEHTGGLDDVQVEKVHDCWLRHDELLHARAKAKAQLQKLGVLNPKLERNLNECLDKHAVKEILLPFKQKKGTLAEAARGLGVEEIATQIWQGQMRNDSELYGALKAIRLSKEQLEEVSKQEGGVMGGLKTAVQRILAENISSDPQYRQCLVERYMDRAVLSVEKVRGKEAAASSSEGVYDHYHQKTFKVNRMAAHAVLAVNRGEKEKAIKVKIDIPEPQSLGYLMHMVMTSRVTHQTNKSICDILRSSVEDGFHRLMHPAIIRQVRSNIKESAEQAALNTYAQNLKSLILTAPVKQRTIIGFDPGFKHGCKLAAIDSTGRVLGTLVIYLEKEAEAAQQLKAFVLQMKADLIAVGNGQAHRQSVAFITKTFKRIKYVIVSEAGASVYSVSALAREELPDLAANLRGAVSIARRLQDPMSEMTKIDCSSIGIGMYQKDLKEKQLKQRADRVIEMCVSLSGIDVNTAASHLLTHIAGIGPKLASEIVSFRNQHGPFDCRDDLKKVKGLGPKAFEQSSGFLRILNGPEPLDSTQVHPESYGVVKKLLKHMGVKKQSMVNDLDGLRTQLCRLNVAALAQELKVGEPTLKDMIATMMKPGVDPREDLNPPVFREGILTIQQLQQNVGDGTHYVGTVRNVVDFGAFIDIGVDTYGLLHKSEYGDSMVLETGMTVEVEIVSVEVDRRRIALKLAGGRKRKREE